MLFYADANDDAAAVVVDDISRLHLVFVVVVVLVIIRSCFLFKYDLKDNPLIN